MSYPRIRTNHFYGAKQEMLEVNNKEKASRSNGRRHASENVPEELLQRDVFVELVRKKGQTTH